MARITREEIRQDLEKDVIVEAGMKTFNFLNEYRNFIIGVVIACVAIWGAVALAGNFRRNVLRQANYTIAVARSDFQRGISVEDPDEGQQLIAQAEERLERVASEFSGRPLGMRALYLLGAMRFQTLEFEAARSLFQQYVDRSRDNVGKARGMVAIGRCLENEAFLADDPSLKDEAMAAYLEAERLGGDSYVQAQAAIYRSRILGKRAETREEAIALLEQVIEQRTELLAQANPLPDNMPALTEEDRDMDLLDGATLIHVAEEELKQIQALME